MASKPRKKQGATSRKQSTIESAPATSTTASKLEEQNEPRTGALFPIVGVGASAGGLEAFTQLLAALPLDTGMAFVLVQHLDPDHESALTQILGRATSLPVLEITDEARVEPNHIYVIAPDTRLSIVQGVLKIQPRERTRAVHRPIDSFFESLASDQHERAVGVVLSGTASDGTLGLEAIKAEGGITFAQDESAKHTSMPRSAVAAGCVDFVGAPAVIAAELARIATHPFVAGHAPSVSADPSDSTHELAAGMQTGSGYKDVLLLLHEHSGVDFSLYKSSTILRRITRRMVLNTQRTLEDYATFLRDNAKELAALYSDVLISVTSFFRNPETFEVLERDILPKLLEQRGDGPLRFWVLGCSTGQEAYSIAMSFVEVAEKAPRMRKLQVFATDLNDALLEKARQGLYPKSVAEDVPPERLRRFFVEQEGGYRIAKSLREKVVFARHNLITDPPFSRMDLISCRNVLIYFDNALQQKVMPMFHYALRPGGFLLLGSSESINGFAHLFEPVDKKHKFFSRKPGPIYAFHLPLRAEYSPMRSGSAPETKPALLNQPNPPHQPDQAQSDFNPIREADRISVTQFAPPGVLVNDDFQVLQFRGATSDFLEPPVGKASFDVLKMARAGLLLPLSSALQEAKKEHKTARRDNIAINRSGTPGTANIEVIPLKNLRERYFLVVFTDPEAAQAGRPREAKLAHAQVPESEQANRIAELEQELKSTRDYLQSMQEQLEASNEELQASNEEVQSANEELQSGNEELETSKEELESANEELTTLNEEMSNRNIELNRLNNDLVNLQASAKLAIVLLGRDLTIRRFSPQADKQFDFLAADIGRPIGHIRHKLMLGDPADTALDLETLCAEVISSVHEQEREVRDKAGRWYSLRVRPYLTLDNRVEGAVMVLVDIDKLKRSEHAVRESEAQYRAMFESTSVGVSEGDSLTGRLLRVNDQLAQIVGQSAEQLIGKTFVDLVHPDDGAKYSQEHARLVRGEVGSFQVELRLIRADRSLVWLHVSVSLVRGANSEPLRTVSITIDITERRRVEVGLESLNAELRKSEKRYRGLFESIDEGFCVIEKIDTAAGEPLDFRYVEANPAVATQAGLDDVVGKTMRQVVPDELESWFSTYEAVLKTGEPVRFERGLPSLGRMLELYAFRLEDDTQRRVAILFKDVTEHKQLEIELRQYVTELAEADSRKDEFLAMLGHELRNPLSALAHGLGLLDHHHDQERFDELRAMMVRQTQRIGTLLDQLLDLARVTSGTIELAKQRVDLAEVVRAAVETVTPLLEAQKHTLKLSLPPDKSAVVLGDALRLTQVVENLLTNATKYTNEGGLIILTLESGEEEVHLSVRDNGIGISAEFLPYVFGLFTQAPQSLDRAKGGLGLGLPLVKRLVEKHEGHVEALSAGPGRGTEIRITLPRRRDQRSNPRSDAPPAPLPTKGQPRRILVVDDEEDMASIFAELLQHDGHQTLAVHDGHAALAALSTFDPEVVLVDLGLPTMDGYEVAKKIREQTPNKHILLIAVTGYRSDAARLKQGGFDHHLIKPPDMQKLAAMIANWDHSDERRV